MCHDGRYWRAWGLTKVATCLLGESSGGDDPTNKLHQQTSYIGSSGAPSIFWPDSEILGRADSERPKKSNGLPTYELARLYTAIPSPRYYQINVTRATFREEVSFRVLGHRAIVVAFFLEESLWV